MKISKHLAEHAVSELMHIGYTVEGDRLIPPEKLSSVACQFFGVQPAAPQAAPAQEPVTSNWKPLKASCEGRDTLRKFMREKLKRHDFDDYITNSLAADFACVLGGYLATQGGV